jgi:AcrR family transcriptional regulator
LTGKRPPGRPRSAEADTAILQSTLELLADEGLRGLSFERVAARAHVGKATVYRRFRSKGELAAAALRLIELEAPPKVDTRSARGDLVELTRLRVAAAAETRWNLLAPRLLIESAGDPELHALVRRILIDPARAAVARILRRGVNRGELPPGLYLELATDVLIGPLVYRVLIDGGDVSGLRELSERLFDVVAGAASRPRGASSD